MSRPGCASGRTTTWPGRVDAEVALAPRVDVVEIQGVLDAPGLGGIGLASAVQGALRIYGHVRESAVGLGEFTWPRTIAKCVTLQSLAKIVETIFARPLHISPRARERPGPAIHGGGAFRVADPLAPGAGVEPRSCSPATSMASRLWQAVTPEPHMQIAASGGTPSSVWRTARAACLDRATVRRVDVVGERVITRAWDVARDRVDGLVAAREPIGAAGIDQHQVRAGELTRGEQLLELGGAHHHFRVGPRLEVTGGCAAGLEHPAIGRRVRRGVRRAPASNPQAVSSSSGSFSCLPGRQAAIEHRDPACVPASAATTRAARRRRLSSDRRPPPALGARCPTGRAAPPSLRRPAADVGPWTAETSRKGPGPGGRTARAECARSRTPRGPTAGARGRNGSR